MAEGQTVGGDVRGRVGVLEVRQARVARSLQLETDPLAGRAGEDRDEVGVARSDGGDAKVGRHGRSVAVRRRRVGVAGQLAEIDPARAGEGEARGLELALGREQEDELAHFAEGARRDVKVEDRRDG